MGLKNIFNTMKEEGYIIGRLDRYLLSLNSQQTDDRRRDINSPSQSYQCSRAIFYRRTGVQGEVNNIQPRVRRILDNGTYTHRRLQDYLLNAGILIMDEIPVFNLEYQILGHTDGLIKLNSFENAVLEIKTINNDNFAKLIDALEEHKIQAQIYMFCLEERRKFLRGKIKTAEELEQYITSEEVIEFYKSLYPQVVDGSKFTKEEKLQFKVEEHQKSDRILWSTSKPINKVVFLYENKNTQELKEFCVKWNDELLNAVLEKFEYVNYCVANNILPEREGDTNKSSKCRFCEFSSICWE